MKAASVTGKQTEVSVESDVIYEVYSGASEVLPKKNRNTPEDMDSESSAHPELNKYQDVAANSDPKGPD